MSTLRCLRIDDDPRTIIRRHLADPANGWSVGGYGAIGEFQYDAGEQGLALDLDSLTVRTARGALGAFDLAGVNAFELVDGSGRRREIAFCTTRRGAQRAVVTALDALTFDLGLALPHVDMLVRLRPDDAVTAAALQSAVGRPLLAADNPAGIAIARASPTRILVSAIARLEVHQPIPVADGRSPQGPHTHLLPDLLAERRVHPPGSLLPAAVYCGLSLYPGTRL